MKGYRVKETNIALPHTAKRLLNIIQQKAKYSELNLSGFFYQIIVAILNSSKTATKTGNVNEYKNLPADYLLAAQQGDIDKVKTCLALGVDINTCDRQGKTAITLASLYQQYAFVQALIDAGADINKQDHTCLNPF